MFTSIFDELKVVKYFKKIITLNIFQESYNVKYFKEINVWGVFKKQSVFRTQASIYDGAFLWI